jgi:hypothetical protein
VWIGRISHEIKSAITDLSQGLSAALSENGRLKAEQWALRQAIEANAPELHEQYLAFRRSEEYLAISSGPSHQAAKVLEIPGQLS